MKEASLEARISFAWSKESGTFFFSFLHNVPIKKIRSCWTEPLLPGYYQYFRRVNVSCSRTKHGSLGEDRSPTSGVRRSNHKATALKKKKEKKKEKMKLSLDCMWEHSLEVKVKGMG